MGYEVGGACRLDAEELNREIKEEVKELRQAAGAATLAAAAERSVLQEKLQKSEADLAETVARLAAAREESEKKLREHWESTRYVLHLSSLQVRWDCECQRNKLSSSQPHLQQHSALWLCL